MAVETGKLSVYTCDAFNCDTTLTVAGEEHSEMVENQGWGLTLIPGKQFCPTCANELRIFLFGATNNDGI